MPPMSLSQRLPTHGDDLDDYGLDDDLDNPFASPTPPPESSSKKRKEPDSGLGIEEEVSVQKRVRVPNVKLDEERLLGPAGIPKLRKRAAGLKLKGKGHEFSDASRLLSFYQLWLDDLFPKARFLDALAMVEKAGHKKALVTARNEWINEGRPKASNDDDDELGIGAVNINEDDDLYDATPRGARRFVNMLRDAPVPPAPLPANDDMPDDDDLEALMAEAESMDRGKLLTVTTGTAAATAAKQNTTTTTTTTTSANGPEADDDDDYLEALIAEAEAQDEQQPAQKRAGEGSALGDQGHDFADEEEAMREMDDLW
ncbi:chromosome segregation in meiosis protein 3 [Trichoderma asperellum]|uniref:Chromosome segregation in meiosis protein n=1 Tax=Trichoderma asperellum TaxID=101201 RepID=A0A6V8QNZ5_TRIAP|nr:Swi3-domain-containing protein [Trichoderma asperelloides]GFP52908.1 chromosome segregation in meiosis protein 3 [Trichoderma asperellum]